MVAVHYCTHGEVSGRSLIRSPQGRASAHRRCTCSTLTDDARGTFMAMQSKHQPTATNEEMSRTKTGPPRASMPSRRLAVAIVGAGLAGIGLAMRLKRAKIDSFTIFESSGDIGGTWSANTYPGAACDTPSILYSYSFRPNRTWSRLFPNQREILEYLRECAHELELQPHLALGVSVERATFDPARGVWVLDLDDGTSTEANVVVSCAGALCKPSIPRFPGIEGFEGPVFHSARWDHDVELRNRDVAIIGSGASAIQIVPQLVRSVRNLYLYQRAPQWILPKRDRALSAFERWTFARFPAVQRLYRSYMFWQRELRTLAFMYPWLMRLGERKARRFLARSISDPALRRTLTPSFTMGCKRVLLSDDYYRAVASSNVEILSSPVESIGAHEIITKDRALRRVDAIILCTGFQVEPIRYPVLGLGGVSLAERWERAPEAYLGTTASDFPNFFFIMGPNTGLGHNSTLVTIEAQIGYILACIAEMQSSNIKYMHVKEPVQALHHARIRRWLGGTVWTSGCRGWYHDRNGDNTAIWPNFALRFRLIARRMKPTSFHIVHWPAPALDATDPPHHDPPTFGRHAREIARTP